MGFEFSKNVAYLVTFTFASSIVREIVKFLYIKERVGRIQGLAHSDEGRIEAIKAEIDRISNEILEEIGRAHV